MILVLRFTIAIAIFMLAIFQLPFFLGKELLLTVSEAISAIIDRLFITLENLK